jgi:hypothetical protein
MGCCLFAGEAEEGRFDTVLQDAAHGTLQRIYHYMAELPGLEGTPTPFLPSRVLKRTANHYASFDAGRGCPYQCSFCTIINVQGRKSRRRTPDDIEHLLRQHLAYGFHWFFVTDDNFARNKDWEPIFDRIITLRERDGLNIKMIIQVDTLCHKIPNFIEKAARRGEEGLHRVGEHQSGQPAGGKEAAEQDHRIPRDAPGLEERPRDHLRRLHPRLPGRYVGIDPRGYRDHQEGAAARYPGVFLPDAAAGVRGS